MKRILSLFSLLLVIASADVALAQTSSGSLTLELTVKQTNGQPMANEPVEFVELNSWTKVNLKTDATGKVTHKFDKGHFWQFNVRDVRNYFAWQVEVVPGKNFNLTRTVTYDYDRYERETRPAVDRKALGLTIENQSYQPDVKPTALLSVAKLEIKKADGSPLINFPVQLTCYKLRKTYSSQTNAAGYATFLVPKGNEYEVDIDGIVSFTYIDLPNTENYRGSKSFTYEPTVIQETTKNDTTVQVLDADQGGTSGRIITKLTLKGPGGTLWANENVYLEVVGEKQVYKGVTNAAGEVRFLLPKGKKYLIHGRFEKNLDVVDLTRRRGIGYSNKTVLYRPQERYQYPDRFIPKPEQVLVDAFDRFLKKQYPQPEDGKSIGVTGKWMQPVGTNVKDAVLNLAFTGGIPPDVSKAPTLNIVFVVDKSGSMTGDDRIGAVIKSLAAFVSKMRAQDFVSLVVFDDHEEVVFTSRKVEEHRQRMVDAIVRLESGGGTYIAKGLKAGYTELMKNYQPTRVNRLILLSDGYGGEPVDETLGEQKPYAAKGIHCTAVGIGEDYNYALLKMLATGGLIEHVGNPEMLEEVFAQELGSALYPVGKDLELEVLFDKQLEYKQFYGAPLLEKTPGRIKVKMKDMFATQNQLAFIRFRVENPSPAVTQVPVTVRLKYKELASGQVVTLEQKFPLAWKEASGNEDIAFDMNERQMYAIAVMNQSLKVMAEEFHKGNLKGAHGALLEALETLKKVYPDSNDEDINTLKVQMEQYLDIIAKQL